MNRSHAQYLTEPTPAESPADILQIKINSTIFKEELLFFNIKKCLIKFSIISLNFDTIFLTTSIKKTVPLLLRNGFGFSFKFIYTIAGASFECCFGIAFSGFIPKPCAMAIPKPISARKK